jgi:hypothetical protein
VRQEKERLSVDNETELKNKKSTTLFFIIAPSEQQQDHKHKQGKGKINKNFIIEMRDML